jgi:mRNA-degrading endonuclease RelE of RelBE toxin-antitoxin system
MVNLSPSEWVASATILAGIFLTFRAPSRGMNGESDKTKHYERDVRKATKKDKGLGRKVESAEREVINDPSNGEVKSISRGSRSSVLAGLIRTYGTNTIYGKNVGKFRILYYYDKDTGDVVFVRFGTHKQLYQGPGHTM